jgi:hypothetical protein
LSQFLLYDSEPDRHFRPGTIGYWSTFQTGLLFANGIPKPAFGAYRLPIFVPQPAFTSGGSVLVWGMVRPADRGGARDVSVDWRAGGGGGYRTLATVAITGPNGVVSAAAKPPGSGVLRLTWLSASGRAFHSRDAAVSRR